MEIRPTSKQEEFIKSTADEVFYGGARGGGKTFACLLDFLGVAHSYRRNAQGILFRRTYKELEEAIKISHELYRGRAQWRVGDKQWTFGSGAVLKLRYLERDEDVEKYQGHSYCLFVDDTITNKDSIAVRAGDVKAGDEVMTLEGMKVVTHVTSPYEAPCVSIAGTTIPTWQKLYSGTSWVSYEEVLGSTSRGCLDWSRENGPLPELSLAVRLAPRPLVSGGSSSLISKLYRILYTSFESSSRPKAVLSSFLLGLLLPFAAVQSLLAYLASDIHNAYVLSGKKTALGFLKSCWSSLRRYDERPRGQRGSAQGSPPSQDDAVAPYRFLPAHKDVWGNTLKGILHSLLRYRHPYTDEVRSPIHPVFDSRSYKVSPVGNRMVVDLTVADCNHYIADKSRLLVKNTNIYFDELGNYPTDYPYLFMFSSLRSAAGVPCYMRATGNPGGVGAYWIKERFINEKEPMHVYEHDGLQRVFIPARLEDNPLLAADGSYEKMLRTLPDHLYKAFRMGDWDVFAGQVFSEWDPTRHVLEPFPLDPSWYRFASMDWGYAKPYSIGFWAKTHEGRLIRFHEIYGKTKPNEGTREQASVVAKKAGEAAAFLGVEDMVADPACWSRQGYSEESIETIFSEYFVMLKGNNDRLGGAYAFHDYLQTDLHDGGPMLCVFPNCKDFIRTIPAITADKKRPEDVDTRAEDHIYDESRYAIMHVKADIKMETGWTKPDQKVSLLRRGLGYGR